MLVSDFEDFWVTLIELPIKTIHDFLVTDPSRAGDEFRYEPFAIGEYFAEHLREPPRRDYYGALFFNPDVAPTKTVVIGNAGGWGTLSNYLCMKLNARNYQFNLGGSERRTFSVHENGKQIRAVITLLEDNGKWQFTQVGDPLSFENPQHYTARKNADKLTTPMLVEYCEKLGLPVQEPRFLESSQPALFAKHIWEQPNSRASSRLP